MNAPATNASELLRAAGLRAIGYAILWLGSRCASSINPWLPGPMSRGGRSIPDFRCAPAL